MLFMLKCLIFLCLLAVPFQASAWREDFTDLSRWQPLLFPKIPLHTSYHSVSVDGSSALQADSKASASGLVLKEPYGVRGGTVCL